MMNIIGHVLNLIEAKNNMHGRLGEPVRERIAKS